MVQRIDFRPEIATPAAPNEPSVEAVRRKVRSHVVDLTPALLSLRDPRLIPLLLRRQRAAQVQAHPRSRSRSRPRPRGGAGQGESLGRNVDLAA